MPRKPPHRRPRAPLPDPAPAEEVIRDGDLADRRDQPDVGHDNVSPDDRAAGHVDDIEREGPARDPEVDAGVIDSVRHVDSA